MELRQLEYFRTVCRELHFTRAAEMLGITQPTLSYQIKLLEDELGVPLFNRVGKKISMTVAGDILYKHCHTVFSSLEGARRELAEWQQAERGTLSIAVLIGEINVLVSRLLGEFYKTYPKLQYTLHGLEDVMKPLLLGEHDFGVTILPAGDERFEQIPLYDDEFYFVAREDHPLAGQASIAFEEIRHEQVVLFPRSHRCRQMIDAICSVKGFQLRPQIETTTIESLLMLIRSGAGVSLLSKTLLQLYGTEGVKMVPITSPPLRREIGIIYLKDKYIGHAAQAFIALIRQHIQSLGHEVVREG